MMSRSFSPAIQPHRSGSTFILTWDGRLDNRVELLGDLDGGLSSQSPDVSLVAAAFERWGITAFARLLGDWAMSIWDPGNRSLLLAKDSIGIRPLFYRSDAHEVFWCSVLDPLVHSCPGRLALAEEYVAGWISMFPATHLTPYTGVYSVPPASYVRFEPRRHSVTRYWNCDPTNRIRYKTDADYEEHFRAAFGDAVRRRLRSDRPILAELSGGMDSSSIVCMADTLAGNAATDSQYVDTLSYHDETEPHWDDRPYFMLVEQRRGRPGSHIDASHRKFFHCDGGNLLVAPGEVHSAGSLSQQLGRILDRNGSRVLLTGTAGDEVTGGVPTPIPELQDLLARCRPKALTRALMAWALAKRKPWIHLLSETVEGFLPVGMWGLPDFRKPAFWLSPRFIERNRSALLGYARRLPAFGPLPSFTENLRTLEALERQIACEPLPKNPPYEIRYPYLDRSLLEFLYAVPRDQLVRPGERRSLMRRALAGVVPREILERKRKAYVARAPRSAIAQEFLPFLATTNSLISAEFGIVDPDQFRIALNRASTGQEVNMVALMRTIEIEVWLRNSPLVEGRCSMNLFTCPSASSTAFR